jgi:hypothetical protein
MIIDVLIEAHFTTKKKKQGLATLIFGAFLAKKMPLMTKQHFIRDT